MCLNVPAGLQSPNVAPFSIPLSLEVSFSTLSSNFKRLNVSAKSV